MLGAGRQKTVWVGDMYLSVYRVTAFTANSILTDGLAHRQGHSLPNHLIIGASRVYASVLGLNSPETLSRVARMHD